MSVPPVSVTTAPDGSFTATLTMTGPGDVRAEYIVVWQPAEFSDFTPWPIPVEIQYKAPRANTWTTVSTVENADWDGTGYAFSAAVPERRKGHWRAFFAGRPNMYRPVTTAPVFVG